MLVCKVPATPKECEVTAYIDLCLLPYLFTYHVCVSTSCAIGILPLVPAVQPFAVHTQVHLHMQKPRVEANTHVMCQF